MEQELAQLSAAVRVLYSSASSQERHAADVWLRSLVGREGAWRSLALLLSAPSASPEERYFAATSLRPIAQRQKGPTEPDAAPALAQLLAQQLASAAVSGGWAAANQLAATLAVLAARTPGWPAGEAVPQLLNLAQAALQAAGAAEEARQLALLRLLACLAEAAGSREVGMHPQRRQALHAALLAAPEPLAAAQQVLLPAGASGAERGSSGSSLAAQIAALQLLQAWCGLGAPPAGAEAAGQLWQHLHAAALQQELGGAAAEALAALYGSCCCSSGEHSSSSTSEGDSSEEASAAHRRSAVLCLLLGQLPGFAAGLQQSLSAASLGAQQQQQQQLFAAFTVLGAAARAADGLPGQTPANGGASAAEAASSAAAAARAVELGAEVALAALEHPSKEVLLAALEHLDEQLERWREQEAAEQQQQRAQQGGGLGNGALQSSGSAACGACSPQRRQALVAQTCGALLRRMVLPECLPPGCATADARDLPDPVQQVRREVSDTFRLAAACVGPQQARQQLLQLAGEAAQAWQQAGRAGAAAAAAGSAVPAGWQQFECSLYALNLVWSRQQQGQEAAAAAEEARQLLAVAAAALDPRAPKLAGTALTLLGGAADALLLLLRGGPDSLLQQRHGQAGQPAQAGDQLGSRQAVCSLLDRLLQLVQQDRDEKLTRNAATCCFRLTGSRTLAAALSDAHHAWGEGLCACFATRGGMRQRVQQGEDLSTEQFLLASACQLAAAAAAVAGGGSSSSSGGLSWLHSLLSQPAGEAAAALAAAAQAPAGGELRLRHLQQAAVQVESIAVALEALLAPSGDSSPAAAWMPGLLGSLSGVLQQAAAAAALASGDAASAAGHGQQQQQQQQQQQSRPSLLQALCKVSSALAGTPAAGAGLELLHAFVGSPPDPAVLLTLAKLVEGADLANSCTPSGPNGARTLPQLSAAVCTALQAAAAQHASDPDWQPAILALGHACLQHLPAAAAEPATLQALLTTAEHSMRSYHRDVCESVLPFAEALCCAGCSRQGGASGGGASVSAASAASRQNGAAPGQASQQPSRDGAALQQLKQHLDSGGLGPALVLGLLLAAAGSMPPYMMVQIADAQHRIWTTVGDARYGAWLSEAALRWAPEGAPWKSWKAEAQQAAVADLLSPLCAADARRFKRLLKVFCGGKKKGTHVEQPARGR